MRLNLGIAKVTHLCVELEAARHFISFLINFWFKPWESLHLSFQRWSWRWPASLRSSFESGGGHLPWHLQCSDLVQQGASLYPKI